MTEYLLYISDQAMWIGVGVAVLLSGILAFLFWQQRKKSAEDQQEQTQESRQILQLRLQAYERLVLLADRISIPNLIQRVGQHDIPASEMKQLLIQTIRQEYDHNITQQIYVSNESWHALTSYKEQNIMIIHKVAEMLPPAASGHELNKQLLRLLADNPNASLHQVVAEALGFEAKKLM